MLGCVKYTYYSNQFLQCKESELRIDVYQKQSWNKMCSNIIQLETCNDMFKVISDIMVHCYDMWNTIITAINFCNAKKMNCALMLIISNHYGIKCLSSLVLLEPCIDMFKVIFDIITHCYDMWNAIICIVHWCSL